jgi:hypothetical protein
MTLPIVTEIVHRLTPVSHDTFIDDLARQAAARPSQPASSSSSARKAS